MLREGTLTKSDSLKITKRINLIKLNSIKENGEQLHTTQTNLENNNFPENLYKNNNFIKALEVMRMNKVELKRILSHNSSCINSECEKNVMEFSITNANLSKEENIAKYLNNPVIKNMEIINNNIRKRRKFNHNSFSAKTPYQMDILIRPFLDLLKMEAIEEKEEYEDKEVVGAKSEDRLRDPGNRGDRGNRGSTANKADTFDKFSNEEEFYDSLDKYANTPQSRGEIINKLNRCNDEQFFINLKNLSSNENSNHYVRDRMDQSPPEEDSLCIQNFKSRCDKLIEHQNKRRQPQRIKQRGIEANGPTGTTQILNTNNKATTERNSQVNSNTIKNSLTNAHTNTNTFTITSKPQLSEAELNLDDLDEAKEINVVDYQIQLDSLNKNRIIKKKLNVSELDVFKNYNVDEDFSQSSDYFFSSNKKPYKNNNKNSKILIVDSDIYSADSIIGNSYSEIDKMKQDKREKTKQKLINNSLKTGACRNQYEQSDKNRMHIYSNSINIKNVYNVNLNSKNFSNSRDHKMTSSNKKTVRRKYYKSEIFENQGKDFENVYPLNILDRIERVDIKQVNKTKINKNLINKFNEIEVVVDKSFECLNLLSSEEDNNNINSKILDRCTSSRNGQRKITNEQSQGNTEEIELYDIQTISEFDNISCNRINFNPFQTPIEKIRKHNRIDDVLISVQIQLKNNTDNDREFELELDANLRKKYTYDYENINQAPGRKLKRHTLKSFMNYKENFSLFNEVEDSFADKVYDLGFVNNMLQREKVYKANPFHLNNHPKLDSSHRTILIDWLMELCEEFAFKRDTFHYAVNYIDRFLSQIKDITKASLQLIGVASLSIAAKFEEIQLPKTEEYINATDNSYSIEEFMKTERYILQTLKWQIIPITINTWLNWYLFQWDLFVETISGVKDAITCNNKDVIYFKKPDENYYFYYRQVTQLIDIFSIDHESLNIPDRFLIAAAIFLTICSVWEIDQFKKENLNKFDYDKEFFLGFIAQKEFYVVKIFSQFLKESLNMEFDDPTLIIALEYSVMYMQLEFNYNLPLVIQSNNGDITHYEDFLSFQTHNDNNFEYLERLKAKRTAEI